MTARLRRRARRGKPDDLSQGLAGIRRDRSAHLGAVAAHLLG